MWVIIPHHFARINELFTKISDSGIFILLHPRCFENTAGSFRSTPFGLRDIGRGLKNTVSRIFANDKSGALSVVPGLREAPGTPLPGLPFSNYIVSGFFLWFSSQHYGALAKCCCDYAYDPFVRSPLFLQWNSHDADLSGPSPGIP